MSTSKSPAPQARKQAVVVEIGNDWLKLAQIETARDGLAVTRLHLEKIEPAVTDPAPALVAAVRKLKPAPGPVLSYLPRQAVNVRMLELPSVDPDEIADMVDLQTARQTPYSKEEIVSGYRVLGAAREGYTRVMLTIVQRAVLRQRFATLEAAGLDVERMSISSEGMLNWASLGLSLDGGATAAVLDVDSFYSDFLVVSGGALVYTRSILLGANQLAAEPDRWQERFVREVEQSIEICRGELPDVKIERVILSGATQATAALKDPVAAALGLPVDVRDCLRGAVTLAAPGVEAGQLGAVSLTPLVGLALAPDRLAFDFVPDGVRLRKGLARRSRRLTVFVSLFVTAMLAASFAGTVKYFLARGRLRELAARREATAPEVAAVGRRQAVIRVVQARLDARLAAIAVFNELHARVPEESDVFFELVELDTEAGRLSLAGSAGATRDVRLLVKSLEDSPLFKDVGEARATTLDPRTNRYRFEVLCRLEAAEERP